MSRVAAGALASGAALLCSLALAGSAAGAVGGGGAQLFGFSDGSPLFPYDGSADATELARLAAGAGGQVDRFTLRWEQVEPTPPPPVGPPRYDWSPVDELVVALRRGGIAPLPMLLGAPGWAREGGCSGVCPPAGGHLADWRTFVRAVAARYPDAAAIEIWNEPNLATNWGGTPDPQAYASLYGAALKSTGDLSARTPVLVGGLALALADAQQAGSEALPDWLAGFFRAARRGGLDLGASRFAIAVHPYRGLDELADSNPAGRFDQALTAVRTTIAARAPALTGVPLWVTETGVSTTAVGGNGATPTEGLQAKALLRTIDELRQQPDIAAILIYTLVDRPPSTDNPAEEGYGVVRRGPGFTPKVSYCALARRAGDPHADGCTTG